MGGLGYNTFMQNKPFKAYFFLGPPGSGKGTQIKMLADKLGLVHLISSKTGKDYIATHDDPATLRQKERYDSGLLWEPEWMFSVITQKVSEIFLHTEGCKGVIFDGSPRTLFEAENFYKFLVEFIGKENLKIINLKVNENNLIDRVANRLICTVSADHVFIKSAELIAGAPCPSGDGGVLSQRDLDKAEIFKVRIDTYNKETIPALEYLKTQHEVIEIDGDKNIDEVHKNILEKISDACESC